MANTIIMTLKCEPRSPSTRANTETPAYIDIVCLTLLLAVRYQFNRSNIAEYIRPLRLAGGIVKRAKFNGR